MSISIGTIDTKPTLDPYHRDTGGQTATTLKINPDNRRVWVEQEWDDNATPSDEWHGLILTMSLDRDAGERPDQDALHAFLGGEFAQSLLGAVCDGFSSEWNGSNIVGVLTEREYAALVDLEQAIADLPTSEWHLWVTEEYLYDWAHEAVSGGLSDEALESLAAQMEQEAATNHIVLTGSALDYITDLRNELRD